MTLSNAFVSYPFSCFHSLNCSFLLVGKEEPQERLDSLRETVQTLHPAIVTVMRYLFKFLKRYVFISNVCVCISVSL